jgi:beta-lactamase regulating signal transducer with metallopeptidase domain/DUF4097 and DUF4098 domain-containing protein YvlB
MTQILDNIGIFLASAPLPILVLAKTTVVLCAGWIIAFALRNSSAAVRHAVWALTLAAAAGLPLGMTVAPAWRVVIAQREPGANVSSTVTTNVAAPISQADISAPPPVSAVSNSQNVVASPIAAALSDSWPVLLWIAGLLFVIGRMILGRILLARIANRGRPLTDRVWSAALAKERLATGVRRRVRLVATKEVSTPLTAGARRPIILLPAESSEWDASHREVILRHELAHIANGDATICSIAGITCALYWFHPLAWIAARKLRTEQERACDDRVLSLGTPATEYASHLLEVARSARALGMHSFVAVAMARPTELEGRLLAVLNEAHSRRPLTHRTKLALTVIAVLTVITLAAFTPVVAEARVVIASQGPIPSGAAIVERTVEPGSLRDQRDTDSVSGGEVVVQPGGTLTLDLKTGADLKIRGSNENVVRMHASLGGRDWRNTIIRIFGDSNNAWVTTEYRTRNNSQSSSHHIDITVPRRFNIRLSSAGGGLELSDVQGEFTGETGGGQIRIERARGRARLSTGGGDVNVSSSNLSGSVSTGGGAVLIQDVTGGLNGSSGTGNVLYGGRKVGVTFSEESQNGIRRASDGRIFSRRSGGSVSVGDAPNGASIQTGGGDIRIGRSSGEVYASTGGGSITIGPLSGSAEASTGAGDVRITVTGSRSHAIKVQSGSGGVTLILPRGLSANLDLETAYTNNRSRPTRIESDWPLSITETSRWDSREGTPRRYVRARQRIGDGGPTIQVRTVNGNIVIKRSE